MGFETFRPAIFGLVIWVMGMAPGAPDLFGGTMDYAAGISVKDLADNKTDLDYLPGYKNPHEFKSRGGFPNVLAKLSAGKNVVIAYLGGSITQQDGWRPRTTKFFREKFPKASIQEINAGISGTGSDFGVARLEEDVLRHSPDLVFVEFAVNDGGLAPRIIRKTTEGIIRKIWTQNPLTDICLVYTVNDGTIKVYRESEWPVFQTTAKEQDAVAEHYNVPSINFAYIVADLEKEGKLVFRAAVEEKGKVLFSADGTHPKAGGDQLYAGAVARAVLWSEKNGKASAPHALTDPLDPEHWGAAQALSAEAVKGTGKWEVLTADPASKSFNDASPQLSGRYVDLIKKICPAVLKSSTPGDSLTVKFKGTFLGLMDVGGPWSGQLRVSVDGGAPVKVNRFTPYNSYMRQQYVYFPEMKDGEHTVVITLEETPPDKRALLLDKADFDKNPEKYQALEFYLGKLLVIGSLIP